MFWAERRFWKGRAVLVEAMTPAVKEPNLQRIKTNCVDHSAPSWMTVLCAEQLQPLDWSGLRRPAGLGCSYMLLARGASPPACHTPDEIPAHTVWTWLEKALKCRIYLIQFPEILSNDYGNKAISAVWGQKWQYLDGNDVNNISDCWASSFLKRKY